MIDGRMASIPDTYRVIGHEFGPERVISVTQRVDEGRMQIVSERYEMRDVRLPKRIVREEVIEKTIVVLEPTRTEEIIQEVTKIREKIVEVARPVVVEKIVEIPEIEFVERTIHEYTPVIKEKVVQKDVVQYQDRIVEVAKVILIDKVVEVADIQYRDVPVERIVEIPEYIEEIVIKNIPVPTYVNKPVAQYVNVEVPVDIERHLPIAVEANVVYEYRLPKIQARYTKVTYPVYLPRFIEVPVAVELLNSGLVAQAESYLTKIGMLTKTAASLCEIENLATSIMKTDVQSQLATVDLQAAITKAWQSGTLNLGNSSSGQYAVTGGYGSGTNYGTTTTINTTSAAVVTAAAL